MKQEDKQLLLKDLCARLPYYPKCEMIDNLRVVNNEKNSSYISTLFPKHIELFSYHNNFIIKPYLRPMSSMTEEERLELSMLTNDGFKFYLYTNEPIIMCSGKDYNYLNGLSILDWLNEHHFDYRGLIEKGLAIAVNESNNPYK